MALTRRSTLTPAERKLRAEAAVHQSWANTIDRKARTSAGTEAFLSRFEKQVDPEGTLTKRERERRAESAKRSYFAALALKASKAKAAKKGMSGPGPKAD